MHPRIGRLGETPNQQSDRTGNALKARTQHIATARGYMSISMGNRDTEEEERGWYEDSANRTALSPEDRS